MVNGISNINITLKKLTNLADVRITYGRHQAWSIKTFWKIKFLQNAKSGIFVKTVPIYLFRKRVILHEIFKNCKSSGCPHGVYFQIRTPQRNFGMANSDIFDNFSTRPGAAPSSSETMQRGLAVFSSDHSATVR